MKGETVDLAILALRLSALGAANVSSLGGLDEPMVRAMFRRLDKDLERIAELHEKEIATHLAKAAQPVEAVDVLRLALEQIAERHSDKSVDGQIARAALAHPCPRGMPSFQERVSDWMDQCFLPSLYSNMTERGDRLLEEALELLQSKGYDRNRVATLVDYVYGRPAGEPSQEVGGVMVTLAGFCWIAGLDMHADGERELARITQPEVMAKIRAKQEAKNALHFDTPLPAAAPDGEVG